MVQYFSWWNYVFIAFVYTGLVFDISFRVYSNHIPSKQYARPLPVILVTHLAILTIFLGIMRHIPSIKPSLPHWITENRGKVSFLELLFYLGVILIGVIERRWIFVKSATDESEPENNPS